MTNTPEDSGGFERLFEPIKFVATKSLPLLCRLGFHNWPEWRTDMEQTDTPDGFLDGKRYWSSCRICKRCYKVDLKQGIEYE
jgi:hypothetical protein